MIWLRIAQVERERDAAIETRDAATARAGIAEARGRELERAHDALASSDLATALSRLDAARCSCERLQNALSSETEAHRQTMSDLTQSRSDQRAIARRYEDAIRSAARTLASISMRDVRDANAIQSVVDALVQVLTESDHG